MIKSFITLAFLICISVNAYSQEPFPCDDSFYQVFTNQGQLITYDLASNTFVTAPNNAGDPLNAFGYRVVDDFAYGVLQDTNLARLGSDGTVVDLGAITGFPGGPTASGDFGNGGLLCLIPNTGFNTIYAVNVDTVSVENTISIAGANFFVSDIAFNPVDGLFYGVTQVADVIGTEVPAALLIAIDIGAGTFEIIGSTGLSQDVVFGSMYADASGRVYGSDRVSSNFYVFDTETGHATALGETVDGSPIDGFFCSANSGPFGLAIPTLSQWGLIAMAGILGIVGFMVIRRRKATA
ncbi:MAG: IPTL-CTERM sorting domain-containing protein [Candidatus Dadabacteria bacterium]|nr:IPTL-CTERM sorting domain-containing protein [Candidatus Dadabacteria bacterium]TDI88501.1 MAG: IPTL-CTERM sorting domain-containing protein [Candidatus Dadabacteria bacterium]TDJ00979.1 MAG: IPTL-CTERM sorting domain-containing protein [Candidatus Dadabacteria bacterium]